METSFAIAGPSEYRAGFHPGQHSPPSNATPRLPRRPHGHGHRAAPRHGLCPRTPCTATRAAAQASKTLTPPHPRPVATPTKETSIKGPAFAALAHPQRRDPIGRPTLVSIDPSCSPERDTRSVLQHRGAWTRSVLLHRARDELGPAALCARRAQSRCTGCETSDGPQLGKGQPFEGSSDRAPRRWGEGQNGPIADKPTPEKPAAAAGRSASHHEAAMTRGVHHRRTSTRRRPRPEQRPCPAAALPASPGELIAPEPPGTHHRRHAPSADPHHQIRPVPAGSQPRATSRDGSTASAPSCTTPRAPARRHQPAIPRLAVELLNPVKSSAAA